jgi:acyl-coenzyme A thioesterase PaaI-like protein
VRGEAVHAAEVRSIMRAIPVRIGRSLAVADIGVGGADGKLVAVGRGLFKPLAP